MEYIPAKNIVHRKPNPHWFGTDYNMNIYKGCNHGCIYCDSRSDCYQIKNFDTVRAKENALAVIRDNLKSKAVPGVVATGAMSDPYNPFEKDLLLTSHALELINAYNFGVAIATKGTLITRDTDILSSIKETAPVLCKITVTTADDNLAKKIEPGAPCSSDRLKAVEKLAAAGIFTGLLLMPVLPFINDSEENILNIVNKAAASGAKFIYPAFGVTLRTGQREWFYKKAEDAFPGQNLAQRYQSKYGGMYQCTSPNAKRLWQCFAAACQRHGLLYNMGDIIAAYKHGYSAAQLSWF